MSLKRNVTQIECHEIGILFKVECNKKLNVTQNIISLEIECHLKCYVTQNGMSPKMKCHSKWNVTQN